MQILETIEDITEAFGDDIETISHIVMQEGMI